MELKSRGVDRDTQPRSTIPLKQGNESEWPTEVYDPNWVISVLATRQRCDYTQQTIWALIVPTLSDGKFYVITSGYRIASIISADITLADCGRKWREWLSSLTNDNNLHHPHELVETTKEMGSNEGSVLRVEEMIAYPVVIDGSFFAQIQQGC